MQGVVGQLSLAYRDPGLHGVEGLGQQAELIVAAHLYRCAVVTGPDAFGRLHQRIEWA